MPVVLQPRDVPERLPEGAGLMPTSIAGRPAVAFDPVAPAFVVHYLGHPIDTRISGVDFYLDGGIRFVSQARVEGSDQARDIAAQFGERAVLVDLGPYRAALVWSDPTRAVDLRTHGLFWTDETRNYELIAYMGPEDLVNVARDLVCGNG